MPEAEAPTKSRFELIVELIKAVAWPLLAIVVLVAFWSPLRRTADLIPSIVGRSDTITIAGLTLKVGRGLKSKASPQVEKVLESLSKDSIAAVLGMPEGATWPPNSAASGRAQNAELIKLGLVVELPQNEIDDRNAKEHRDYVFGVRQTPLGKQTQVFLQAVVAEFVEELEREAPNKATTDS